MGKLIFTEYVCGISFCGFVFLFYLFLPLFCFCTVPLFISLYLYSFFYRKNETGRTMATNVINGKFLFIFLLFKRLK